MLATIRITTMELSWNTSFAAGYPGSYRAQLAESTVGLAGQGRSAALRRAGPRHAPALHPVRFACVQALRVCSRDRGRGYVRFDAWPAPNRTFRFRPKWPLPLCAHVG